MKKPFLIIFIALTSLSLLHAQPFKSFTVDPPAQNRSGLIRLRGIRIRKMRPGGTVQVGLARQLRSRAGRTI